MVSGWLRGSIIDHLNSSTPIISASNIPAYTPHHA
jgi:hypothetical protein